MAQTNLDLLFRAIDKTSQVVAGIRSNLAGLAGDAQKFAVQQSGSIGITDRHGQAVTGLGRTLQYLGGQFQGVGQSLALGFTVPLVASAAVLTQFDQSASKLQVAEAFGRTAKQLNQSSKEIIEALDKAAGGTISDLDLMAAASRAMILGVTHDAGQFVQLMEIARDRARVFGVSTTQAFNDLTLGIGRQSRLILDNLGIIVRLEDATENYAKSIGKSVNELSLAERQQSFLNAVLAQTEATIDRTALATRTASEDYLAQRAAIDDLITEVQNKALPVLTEFLAAFNALPMPVKLLTVLATGLMLVMGPLLSAFGAVGRMIGGNVVAFGRLAAAYRAATAAQVAFTAATLATTGAQRGGLMTTANYQASQVKAQGAITGAIGLLIARIGLLSLAFLTVAGVGVGKFTGDLLKGKNAADSYRSSLDFVTFGLGKMLGDLIGVGDAFRTNSEIIDRNKEKSDEQTQKQIENLNKVGGVLDRFNQRMALVGQISGGVVGPQQSIKELMTLLRNSERILGGNFDAWKLWFEQIGRTQEPSILIGLLEELTTTEGEMNVKTLAAGSAFDVIISKMSASERVALDTASAFQEVNSALSTLFGSYNQFSEIVDQVAGQETKESLILQRQSLQYDLIIQQRIAEVGTMRQQKEVIDAKLESMKRESDLLSLQINTISIQIREREMLIETLKPQALVDEVALLESEVEIRQRVANGIQRQINQIERQAQALERANRPLERQINLLDIQARKIELASRPARRHLEALQKIPGISGDVTRAAEAVVQSYDDQIAGYQDAADAIQLEIDQRQIQIDQIRDSTWALQDELDVIDEQTGATRDLIAQKRDYIATLAPAGLQREIDQLTRLQQQLQLQRDKLGLLIQQKEIFRVQTGNTFDPIIDGARRAQEKINAAAESLRIIAQIRAIDAKLNFTAPGLQMVMTILGAMTKFANDPAGLAGFFKYVAAMRARPTGLTGDTFWKAIAGLFGLPQLQHGGVVNRPTVAMLGERGPEAVIPLNRALPAGRPAPNVYVTIEGNVYGEEELVDQVVTKIRRRLR